MRLKPFSLNAFLGVCHSLKNSKMFLNNQWMEQLLVNFYGNWEHRQEQIQRALCRLYRGISYWYYTYRRLFQICGLKSNSYVASWSDVWSLVSNLFITGWPNAKQIKTTLIRTSVFVCLSVLFCFLLLCFVLKSENMKLGGGASVLGVVRWHAGRWIHIKYIVHMDELLKECVKILYIQNNF